MKPTINTRFKYGCKDLYMKRVNPNKVIINVTGEKYTIKNCDSIGLFTLWKHDYRESESLEDILVLYYNIMIKELLIY